MKTLVLFGAALAALQLTAPVLRAQSATVAEALAGFDDQYDGFLDPWLASLWDPASGGQRITASASTTDIQSSGQFVTTLNVTGLLTTVPPEVKSRLITYFQSHQNLADGYFYDFAGQNLDDRNKGRYLGYATGALADLGAAPLHPLPTGDSGGTPSYLQTTAAFRAWLEALPWDNPWTSGDRINAQLPAILLLPNRAELEADLLAFLPTKRQTNGYWGNSSTDTGYTYLSGGAKISSAYSALGVPVPMAQELYDSTKNTLFTKTATAATHVRNAIWTIKNIKESGAALTITEADKIAIIDKTAANIANFLNPDGGFGISLDGPSHMDAASQAHKARAWSYEFVADLPPPGISEWPGTDTFWQLPKFDFTERDGGSFEAEDLTRTPSGATATLSSSGGASGGTYVQFDGDSAGDSITFTTPSLTPGTYRVRATMRYGNNRAIAPLSGNGTNLGSAIDMFDSSSFPYVSIDYGDVTLTTSGPLNLIWTATGKNPSSTGFLICIDRIDLIPANGFLSASSTTGTAGNAIDTDPATAWIPENAGDFLELELDLGHERNLSGVTFRGNPSEFTFQSSTDGVTWAPLPVIGSTGSAPFNLDFTDAQARLIRVIAQGSGPFEGVFEIAPLLAPPPEPPPTLDLDFAIAADTHTERQSPAMNFGTLITLNTKNSPTQGTDRHVYLRFPITGITTEIVGAALHLKVSDPIPIGDGGRVLKVFGINETNADEAFPETGLTFGNSTNGTTTNNDSLLTTDLTDLGTFTLSEDQEEVAFSSAALSDFLSADTNGTASFLIRTVSEEGTPTLKFASKEHATLAAPALSLTVIDPNPPLGALSIEKIGTTIRLSWTGAGVLQSNDDMQGAWADVDEGNATSPFVITAPATKDFFRLRRE